MIDTYQGDPALKITLDGADLTFKGGQPVMDQGLENQAQISLFTGQGWPGNFLLPDEGQLGSSFETKVQGPITLSSLAELEKTAEDAISAPVFGTIRAEASNPESWRIDLKVTIEPPGRDVTTVLLSRNGQNWISQALNPANERL
ncbi:MAG: hypothetical protein V3T82_07175 [Nitrospinaceae bacterium]